MRRVECAQIGVYDPVIDTDLCALDAAHLFGHNSTHIGFRRGTYLRGYMYDFIETFAPHLTPDIVNKAIEARTKEEIEALFASADLPAH